MHNVKQHNYIKHINVQYYYIQNIIDNKELIINKICISEILTDKLTKNLTKNTFKSHCQQLEVVWFDEINRQKK